MLKILHLCVLIVCCSLNVACSRDSTRTAQPTNGGFGVVERRDTRIDELIPIGAMVEKVADGFEFIEGPVWVPTDTGQHDGQLLFSDIPANTVYSWSKKQGTKIRLQPVLDQSLAAGGVGGSNGLALDHQGNLVLCEHGNRRIARLEQNESRTTLADQHAGKRLNSPNDIVFHSSGAAFFTDPPYGLTDLENSALKEQPHNGVYRLDVDGTVTLLAAGQTRPNGIGLSPDERILYVANSDRGDKLWMAYPLLDDLLLGEGYVFFDANSISMPGVPDGLAVDVEGNVFATGPGGVLVINAQGHHLGTITPNEQPANVGWGDDGKSLYMTARTGLYRIKLSTLGLVYRG